MRLARVAEALQEMAVDCEYAVDFSHDTMQLLDQLREAALLCAWAADEVEMEVMKCAPGISERLKRGHGESATCAGDSTS